MEKDNTNKAIKDVIKVFSSNLVILFSGIITGFLVPKFLGIEQYALYKTFGLYISFVGILHFGFIDGIYIKYGGIKLEEIPKEDLKTEWLFLILMQIFIVLIGVCFSFYIKNMILFFASISILPINLTNFYKFIFQATGKFGIFSKINVLQPFLWFVSVLILIFILKNKNYSLFILMQIITLYFIFLILVFTSINNSLKKVKINKLISKNNFSNIKIGIFIMIGNLSGIFFYSMDRWFVKILLTVKDFAYYSFAISMMSMVLILISSVAMTFYPMLVHEQNNPNLIGKLKKYLLILGSIAASSYFILEFIVTRFLNNYIPSLDIISILFAGFPAIATINAIYVNLYKAKKQEKKYFFTVIGMAIVSFGFNVVAIMINESNIAIAIATTMAFYFWLIYSSKDFKGTRISTREIFYISSFLILFFWTTEIFKWWFGFSLYLILMLIITKIIYPEELKELIFKIIQMSKLEMILKRVKNFLYKIS